MQVLAKYLQNDRLAHPLWKLSLLFRKFLDPPLIFALGSNLPKNSTSTPLPLSARCYASVSSQQLRCIKLYGLQTYGHKTISETFINNFSKLRVVEFRNVDDLTQIIGSQTVKRHLPYRMHSQSPSTLLYTDVSTMPCTVRWLDCSKRKLRDDSIQFVTKEGATNVIHAQDEDDEFLISAHGKGGIYAYNSTTGTLEWCVKGRQPGMDKDLDAGNIAVDNHGHIFVCDVGNGGIQMFSVSDGRYLGCLVRKGDQGFGGPFMTCWGKDMSSFIVIDTRRWIREVEIRYD